MYSYSICSICNEFLTNGEYICSLNSAEREKCMYSFQEMHLSSVNSDGNVQAVHMQFSKLSHLNMSTVNDIHTSSALHYNFICAGAVSVVLC